MIKLRRFCRSAVLPAPQPSFSPRLQLPAKLDVAIRGGHIGALKKGSPASSAFEVIDAEGRLVVPGAATGAMGRSDS